MKALSTAGPCLFVPYKPRESAFRRQAARQSRQRVHAEPGVS